MKDKPSGLAGGNGEAGNHMFGTFTIQGRDKAEDFLVTQTAVSVGRAGDNDLTLPYATVSLHHARILADAAGCRIVTRLKTNTKLSNVVDNAVPSGSALAVDALLKLAAFGEHDDNRGPQGFG